jgi:hypothetical protein
MKPSEALQLNRADIRRVVENHDACSSRVFGSVLHGNDTEGSDLDLLVDPFDGKTSLFSIVRIKRDMEAPLGVKADALTSMAPHECPGHEVLREAVPV